jgi:predicted kinase
VLGILRGLAPRTLLDLGSGRGTFLWPLLDSFPELQVTAVDRSHRRASDISLAREKAREHLRQNRSFVWNATNISSQVRAQCIDLFARYNARVRIVYVEAQPETLYRQNRERDTRVPENVINKLLERWEIPRISEAHRVEWIVEQ